jgi:uroporphyrinogen decarboxylase
MPIVGDLVAIGVDSLNPIEVKAGMDPVALKRDFGDQLTLHGGTNAAIWHDRDAIVAEIESIIPTMMQGGGYVFASDHSIPSSVSFETFQAIVDTYKRVASYD